MSTESLVDEAYASTVLLGSARPAAVLADAGLEPAGVHGVTRDVVTDASAPPSLSISRSEPPSAGTRIGHYELLRELGRGGMGTVFLARDTRLARLVAIKLLTRLSRSGLQRFLIEAQATARCNHEHIVTIHEVNEHNGYPYMLEFIEGQSLRAWMSQRRSADASEDMSTAPLPPSLTVDMMVPVVRALCRAHASGIIHRDLKPENIMLEASGAIKVVDFGIAKLREDEGSLALAVERSASETTRLTGEGAVIGTMPYMSPEQWRGKDIDQSSDIWAVGIMLHELVLGEHPLAPVSQATLFSVALLDEPMPQVSARHPELGALGAIIDRCLCKRKSERFASAQELLAELLPLLPGRREILLGSDDSPFAGLSSFQEADADRFFGRAQDLAGVVARLRNQPLLALAGASGVGKSSLVRAGVIPALKRSGEGWEALVVRPGREPMAALADLFSRAAATLYAARLTPVPPSSAATGAAPLVERLRVEPGLFGASLRAWSGGAQRRLLLFVDQFEELFTLGAPASEREAFLACLTGVADDASSPLRVVLAVRSDFLERMAEHEHFMAAMLRGLVFLRPMGREGLREALMKPIEAARCEVEDPEMIEGFLDALATTRGALPLLQFTAARLWEMRDRGRKLLTRESYEALGGVAGALASHADTVLAGMSERRAKLARVVLERLVTPERTRAVASLGELCELPGDRGEIERVVELLADGRLLAIETGSDRAGSTVEIVHESLIERWPTLKRWLDENQEDAAFLDRLRAAARLWDASGRAADTLWRGKVAKEARGFRERYRGDLPEREQLYLDEVLGFADQQQRGRRRLVSGVIAALSVLAVAAGAGFVKLRGQYQVIVAQIGEIRMTEATLKTALASEEAQRSAAERARQDSEAARQDSEAQRRRAERLQHDAEEARDRAEAEAERARVAANQARMARDEAQKAEAEARTAEAKATEEEQKAKAAAEAVLRSKNEQEQLIERAVGKIGETLK
ncbi:Protein kinase [Sorangium cellulosum So ce56]|uniref:Protein kinase n=1 Tax=Sorangium cellulosum (strain So ce56) TaxID=448385 RepID=A9GN79_SORC5|nr:serine/threonine-protein kinase [Sorangium cellulosum]CAN93545.1 Protein kinase [Sorangium cellulosum So ce56]